MLEVTDMIPISLETPSVRWDPATHAKFLELAKGREPSTPALDVLSQIDVQVKRRGKHEAVRATDATFTYGQLDAHTARATALLRSLGVGPEAKVGISLHRGAFELITILATLRAGGAYVPLDPSHPSERLRLVLEDSRPQVLILEDDSPLAAAAPEGTRIVRRSEFVSAATAPDGPVLAMEPARPKQLSYVLYTSGSTGKPKGVEIERDAFANFITSMQCQPGFSESDCLLAVTTTTFDIAGLELFLPLCVGGTVEIVSRDIAMDPKRLRERLENPAITYMQATPATWRLLIEAGWKGHPRLRLLCGGEAMSPELAARLVDRCGELWNMYGPTETTVWSTLERIQPVPGATTPLKITIGRPIDRTQIYILGPGRALLPPGEVGEIFIGGDGLARGYHLRPDLTGEKFIPSPFEGPGRRIYGTGDLGRMLPDGRLECLGRIDHQVKIRGYRIELGEIESVLRGVPHVNEVLVVAHKADDGDPSLVAYWVGNAERAQLQAAAKARLPLYMTPSAYIPLPAFPLNTNGKIDRKALPSPTDFERPTVGLAPRNDLEKRIATVFASVLGQDAVGVDQDFFSLGGTSVLAISARAKLEEELGTTLPMRIFFENPTVEGIVHRLNNPGRDDAPIVVTLQKGQPGKTPLHCLFGIHLYSAIALAITDGTPVTGMHVPFCYIPGKDPRPTISQIADRYLALIRQQQPKGPYQLAGLCFGGVVAYEVARRLRAEGESVRLVVIFDAILPDGRHVNHRQHAIALAKGLLKDPRAGLEKLASKGATVALPWLKKLPIGDSLTRWMGAACTQEPTEKNTPIDLPVDGPEADADVDLFAMDAPYLDAKLLVFRASRDDNQPAFIQVDMHMGWQRLAKRVIAQIIDSDHLGIVRPPHVAEVARTIMAELA